MTIMIPGKLYMSNGNPSVFVFHRQKQYTQTLTVDIPVMCIEVSPKFPGQDYSNVPGAEDPGYDILIGDGEVAWISEGQTSYLALVLTAPHPGLGARIT